MRALFVFAILALALALAVESALAPAPPPAPPPPANRVANAEFDKLAMMVVTQTACFDPKHCCTCGHTEMEHVKTPEIDYYHDNSHFRHENAPRHSV